MPLSSPKTAILIAAVVVVISLSTLINTRARHIFAVFASSGDREFSAIINQMPKGNQTTAFCVEWEKNIDGWWTSNPDWFVSLENDTHYCLSPMEDEAKASFMRELHDIQHNGNCSTLVIKQMWSSGWGADFLNVNDGLLFAFETKQPVELHDIQHWHYAANKQDGSNPVCPRKDMSCYFLNISSCEVPDDIPREKVVNDLLAKNHSPRIQQPMAGWVYEYATRPQTWLRRAVYEYSTNSVNLPSPCAAIHVRRADVVLHGKFSRKYHEIQEYIEAATERNRSLHRNDRSIFLLTDDQNAIEEAHSRYPDYKWVYLDRPRHRGTEGGWENQTPSKDPKLEVIVMLSIFRLVQKCDTLIHSTSNFASYIWHYMSDSMQINIDNGKEGVRSFNNSINATTPN